MDLSATDGPSYDFSSSDLILMIGRQCMVVFLICMFFFLDTGPITSPFAQAQSLVNSAAATVANVTNVVRGTPARNSSGNNTAKAAAAAAKAVVNTVIATKNAPSNNNTKAAAAAAIVSK